MSEQVSGLTLIVLISYGATALLLTFRRGISSWLHRMSRTNTPNFIFYGLLLVVWAATVVAMAVDGDIPAICSVIGTLLGALTVLVYWKLRQVPAKPRRRGQKEVVAGGSDVLALAALSLVALALLGALLVALVLGGANIFAGVAGVAVVMIGGVVFLAVLSAFDSHRRGRLSEPGLLTIVKACLLTAQRTLPSRHSAPSPDDDSDTSSSTLSANRTDRVRRNRRPPSRGR
jgi:hypothetical protein